MYDVIINPIYNPFQWVILLLSDQYARISEKSAGLIHVDLNVSARQPQRHLACRGYTSRIVLDILWRSSLVTVPRKTEPSTSKTADATSSRVLSNGGPSNSRPSSTRNASENKVV